MEILPWNRVRSGVQSQVDLRSFPLIHLFHLLLCLLIFETLKLSSCFLFTAIDNQGGNEGEEAKAETELAIKADSRVRFPSPGQVLVEMI